jgi:hypothetical protein
MQDSTRAIFEIGQDMLPWLHMCSTTGQLVVIKGYGSALGLNQDDQTCIICRDGTKQTQKMGSVRVANHRACATASGQQAGAQIN